MSLRDINNRQSILNAIAEFDQLGRKAFLEKYGFGQAHSYFLKHGDALYDSKAIMGAAHGYEYGTPLSADEFSGGAQTVQQKLEELGFAVMVENGNPIDNLSADELELGDVLSNRELMSIFTVGQMGGMRRSVEREHLVVVSDHTKSLYEDRWKGNVLHYTGMGKVGDQSLTSQNRTLARSIDTGIKVYLFEVFDPGRYKYHGLVLLDDEPYQEVQPDKNSNLRNVWMFPVKLLASAHQPVAPRGGLDLVRTLRQRALRKLTVGQLRIRARASAKDPPRRSSKSEQIIRNEAVAAYVKKAALGKCDLCDEDAPFVGKDKEPFLECHHVIRLADGGDDTIENAVGLCPNCHRKMHALNYAADRRRLKKRIKDREATFSR